MNKEDLRKKYKRIYKNRILNQTKYVKIDAWLKHPRFEMTFTDKKGRKVELPNEFIDTKREGTNFIVDISNFTMICWKPEYGFIHVRMEVGCSARYELLNDIGESFCVLGGWPPEGVLPCHEEPGKNGCRYIEFDILENGKVTNWPCPTDFDEFIRHGDYYFTIEDKKWIDQQLNSPDGDVNIKSIPYKCTVDVFGYDGPLDKKDFTDPASAIEYMRYWIQQPQTRMFEKIEGCHHFPFYRQKDESGEASFDEFEQIMINEKYDYIRRFLIPNFFDLDLEESENLCNSSDKSGDVDDSPLPF